MSTSVGTTNHKQDRIWEYNDISLLRKERRPSKMYGRFGKRFGPWFQDNWEGWTPPWMQREGPGPRFFGGQPGPGFGPRGPFGGWQWGSPESQAFMSEGAEGGRLFASARRGGLPYPERPAPILALLGFKLSGSTG